MDEQTTNHRANEAFRAMGKKIRSTGMTRERILSLAHNSVHPPEITQRINEWFSGDPEVCEWLPVYGYGADGTYVTVLFHDSALYVIRCFKMGDRIELSQDVNLISHVVASIFEATMKEY